MDQTQMKCLVIIKNGVNDIDRYEYFNNEYGRKLIVDIRNAIEEYKCLGEKCFNKIVDKYIEENKFTGTKVITLTELLDYEDFLKTKKRKYSGFLKKVLKENDIINTIGNSKLASFIGTVLTAVILYFFYQLGYAFLYGYYFGGAYNDSTPIFNIFINPVPFNFKSIVGVGVLLLIFMIIIFLPLVRILHTKKMGEVIGLTLLFIGSIFIIVISCSIIFFGSDISEAFINMYEFILLLVIMPLMIFFTILFFKKTADQGEIFLSYILWSVICTAIFIKTYNLYSYIENVSFLGVIIGTSIFSFIGDYVSEKFYKVHSTKLYKFISELFKFYPFVFFSSLAAHLFLQKFNIVIKGRFILFICSIAFFIWITYKNFFIINNKKKIIQESNKHTKKNKDTLQGFSKFIFIVMSILIMIGIIITITIVPHLSISTGKMVRSLLIGLPKEKITWDETGDKTVPKIIFGNLVAQKDDTYYISKLPERKLITVKNSSILTMPCEQFVITQTPDQLLDMEELISKKFSTQINNSNVIIKMNASDPNKVFSDGFRFTKEIYSKLDSDSNKLTQHEFGIRVTVEYSFNKDGKVDDIKLIFAYKMPNDIKIKNKELYKKLKDMLREYNHEILKMFSITTIDRKNTEYYYSNGVMQLSINKGNGWTIERYSLNKIID